MKILLFKKPANKVKTFRPSRFSPFVALSIAVLVGGFGVWTLRNSSAAGETAIFINVLDRNTSAPMRGALVQMGGPSCPGHSSINVGTVVDNPSYGTNVQFWGCPAYQIYELLTADYPNYYMDPLGPGTKKGTRFLAEPPAYDMTVYLTPIPAFQFTADKYTLTKGEGTWLRWSSRNDGSCQANWDSISRAGTSYMYAAPNSTTTYTLTCGTTGNKSAKSVTLIVNNPPASSSGGTSSTPSNNTGSGSTTKPTTKKATPAPVAPTVKTTGSDTSAPTKPDSFSATLTTDAVDLTWSSANDNVGVTGYLVERSIDGTNWSVLGTSTTTSRTDAELPNDTPYYYYRLRAQDAAGNQSEATFVDIENVASDSENSAENTPQTTTLPAKKETGSPLFKVIIGSILILAAIAGGAWWLRHRADQFGDTYYDTPSHDPHATTPVITPQQTGQAPHTSKSLKDMVLEDLDSNKPPKPPGSQ